MVLTGKKKNPYCDVNLEYRIYKWNNACNTIIQIHCYILLLISKVINEADEMLSAAFSEIL